MNTKKLVAGAVVSVGLVHCMPAMAAWELLPIMSAESRYSDNMRLNDEYDDGVSSTATVQLGGRRADDRSKMDFVAGGTFTDYSGVENYDGSSAQFARFNGKRSLQRGGFGLSAQFKADDSKRIYNQISEDIGDTQPGELFAPVSDSVSLPVEGETDVDVGIVEEQVDRTQFVVSPFVEYDLTRQSKATLYYRFLSLDYDSRGEELGFRDSERQMAGIEYAYALSDRNRLALDASVSELSPDGRDDSDAVEVKLGWTHDASERLRFNTYIGAREIDDGTDEETGLLFRLEADRQLQNGRLRASIEKSLYPSAYGRIVEADTFTFGYSTDLTRRVQFGLNIQVLNVESDGNDADDDREYISVNPGIKYAIAKNWFLRANYAYEWIERESDIQRGFDDSDAHSVSLGIEFRPRRRL